MFLGGTSSSISAEVSRQLATQFREPDILGLASRARGGPGRLGAASAPILLVDAETVAVAVDDVVGHRQAPGVNPPEVEMRTAHRPFWI